MLKKVLKVQRNLYGRIGRSVKKRFSNILGKTASCRRLNDVDAMISSRLSGAVATLISLG